MKNVEKKNCIKQLLRNELGPEEQTLLLQSRSVSDYMRMLWNHLPDSVAIDQPDSSRIWNRICGKAFQSNSDTRFPFYKIYASVASVLLLLSIGGFTYWNISERAPETVYIVSSGIQNMESITLPDGTSVQMGPGSRLTYPARFTETTREVVLDGQAFFDVAHNPSKSFIVHASTMDIQALGTAFEVFDYGMENKSETVLLRGEVKVTIPTVQAGKTNEIILSPNEKILYNKKEGSVSKSTVDADKYTAWRKQKMLSFENEKLSMIIPRLEKWYGRKVICQKDLSEQYRFTFKIKDETLDLVLVMISKSSPLKYTKTSGGDYLLNLK